MYTEQLRSIKNMTVDYYHGKIYKIEYISDPNVFYIGSTVQTLAKRKGQHKTDTIRLPDRKIYKFIREHGGWVQFQIILIELHNCTCSDELRAREDYYMKLLKPALNTKAAFQTAEELKEYKKEYEKEYEKSDERIASKKDYRNRIYQCVCGSECTLHGKSLHFKTKKHINWCISNPMNIVPEPEINSDVVLNEINSV